MDHAVIAYLVPAAEADWDVFDVEDQHIEAIEKAGGGKFDGNLMQSRSRKARTRSSATAPRVRARHLDEVVELATPARELPLLLLELREQGCDVVGRAVACARTQEVDPSLEPRSAHRHGALLLVQLRERPRTAVGGSALHESVIGRPGRAR
jgi:hypothetical protein